MAAEGADTALAMSGFVLGDVFQGRLLHRVVVRQLGGDDHRADRQEGALDILAANAQEVIVGDAVGLIDQALVALFLQRLLRQGRRGAGTTDQHGIRLGGDDLENLTGHRGVVALIALVGDDLQLAGFGDLGKLLVPALAVSVGETDESDGLHVLVGHVLDQRGRHVGIVLGGLEHPLALVVHGLDDNGRAGHRNQRCLVFNGNVHHGQRTRGGRGADDDVDLVLADQLLDVLGGRRRVGGVIEHDVVDLLAADGGRQQREGVFFRNAERGSRAGGGNGNANVDVGQRGGGQGGQNGQGQLLDHHFIPDKEKGKSTTRRPAALAPGARIVGLTWRAARRRP